MLKSQEISLALYRNWINSSTYILIMAAIVIIFLVWNSRLFRKLYRLKLECWMLLKDRRF